MALPNQLLEKPVLDYAIGIQQRINAGHNFNGSLPSAVGAVREHGCTKFAAANTGGLFYFEGDYNVVVEQFMFDFGDGASVDWTLSVVNLDDDGAVIAGESTRIHEGKNEEFFSQYTYMHLLLAPRQALQLVTTGGNKDMVARIWVSLRK